MKSVTASIVFPTSVSNSAALGQDRNHAWDDQVEGKTILAVDLGRVNVTIDGAAEYQFEAGPELEPGFSGGISRKIIDELIGGTEIFTAGTDPVTHADMDLRGAGIDPTASLFTPRFRVTSGVYDGIAGGANKLDFHAVIGMNS